MTSDGVRKYTTGTVEIHFPEGHVCCDLCPLMQTYSRKYCSRTGELLLDSRTIGWECPIQFKEDNDEQL